MNGKKPLTPPMLTYAQTAALVGRSVSTVEKWVRNQNIPFHRIGRNIRFDPVELRQWLEENEITSDNRIRPARPLKKRPGAQYVFPSDTLGDEEHCWCGDTLGHDWTGKDKGAPHPHDHEGIQQVVIVEPTPGPRRNRIEKTDLRGYHAALKSFIIRCVNIDGLGWRGQQNSVLLYPPDDTQPITVYCRNNDSQIRSLKQWYAAHVEPQGTVDDPAVTDQEAIARLAETVNDPVEHPVSKADHDAPSGEWLPYLNSDGELSEFYETNGVLVRCRLCVGRPTAYETPVTEVRGLGGHIRMNHRDTASLRDEEARAKAVDSRRYNRLHEKVKVAVELLAETIGYETDHPKVTELERENARLRTALADAETRIQLMREAFKGLE
jgi:excisionase family DNA binding protein